MNEKECDHKNYLPMYVRDGKTNWISSKQIYGEMIYVCVDCGKTLKKTLKEIEE